ncbi:MAG: biosynthetic peptidoglycan transglycosylase, partial [Parvularculaceae bacterium]
MASGRKGKARRGRRRRGSRRRAGRVNALARHGANAGVALLTALLVFAGAAAWMARELPDTDHLWAAEKAPRITLLDIDGAPIAIHGASYGAPVRLGDLPAHVPLAVLAVEDRNFRHHIGFNPVSLVRALLVNAEAGEVVQGGSTITQQLAKNLFLSPERTMKRKVQELMLALWLEMQFSKDEILTLYLNRVYFGAGAYGVDAASHRYFAKPARALSVAEAAVLAGLLKA